MKLPAYIKISPYRYPPSPEKVGHTTRIYVPNSFQTVVWVLLSPTRTRYVKVPWDRTYGFSSLSKKTRKSIHLQMSLHKRQQFLLSYLKTLSVGPGKVWICDLPSADQCSPKWAKQVVIKCELSTYQPSVCWHIDPRPIVPNSFQTVVWVLLSPTRTRYVKVLCNGWNLYGFSSLSKRTRKSIHLQMSLHKR